MNRVFQFFCAVSVTAFSISCKVNKTMRTPYTSYFVDNNVNLYFIKPLEFQGPESKVTMDFTFKDDQALDTLSVTCNYTIEALPANIKKQIYLQSDSAHHLYKSQILFVEMRKGKQVERYTSKLSLSSLMHLLHSSGYYCLLSNNSSTEKCIVTSKSDTRQKRLKANLLPTLDLRTRQ